MTERKKDLLKKLGIFDPMESIRDLIDPPNLRSIREHIAALTTPAYSKQMDELINPTYLKQIRDQMDALTNPSYLQQMDELINPPYLNQMRDQMAALTNPPYFQKMDELINTPYLKQMRDQMDELINPPHLKQMRDQMAGLTNPPHLQQMDELINPPYLKQMREQMEALTKPSYLQQLSTAFHGGRIQDEATAVMASYQELIGGSALASFLVSLRTEGPTPHDTEDTSSLERDEFAAHYFETLQGVDLQIARAITEGEVAALPPSARERLQSIYLQLVVYWDMLIRIFTTYTAYVLLTTLTSGVTTPTEIPKQIEQLSNYERQLLADYRVVNRDGARLRAEPNKAAEVIVKLKLGIPVEVLERNEKGWFRVSVEYKEESVEGWIHLTVTTPVPPPKRPPQLLAAKRPAT